MGCPLRPGARAVGRGLPALTPLRHVERTLTSPTGQRVTVLVPVYGPPQASDIGMGRLFPLKRKRSVLVDPFDGPEDAHETPQDAV